ncbi:MAG: cytochrome C biogenesis protein [Nitrospiraceae bacterium]
MIDSLPHTSLMAAFLAGLLSFVSPCVLPLVPSYLTYITGLSLDQLTHSAEREGVRKLIVVHALLFIGGFSAVFIAFGASASLLGQLVSDYQHVIRKIGAVLIIVFGLYLMGVLKPPLLMTEKRIHLTTRPAGSIGSAVVGATFAAGWTPCVGPVLGTMLLYAGTTETLMDGITLLAFYSLGLALPFLAASLALGHFLRYFKQANTSLRLVSSISGIFLIMMGIVMYAYRLSLLTAFFERYGIGAYLGTDGG